MNIFEKAVWITTADFACLEKINVFHRECEKRKIPEPKKLQNYHAVFSFDFTLGTVPEDASLLISADDYYSVFINGKLAGVGPAQGYRFAYNYNNYNIAPLLKNGINNIEARVYYHGLVSRSYQSADCRMGLIAEIRGGGEVLAATSRDWQYYVDRRYKKAHVIGYNTLFSENFDYRVKNGRPVPAVEFNPDYTFRDTPAVPVSIYPRRPAESRKLENGGYFFDFGREITGMAAFEFISTGGGSVRIYMGEEEEDNETGVRWKMRCSCECDDKVTFAKNDCGTYIQSDYRAFRYLAIIPKGKAELRNVRALVRHYPFSDSHCVLETENEKLKAIFDICKNGVKYGTQDIFTDCPLREKGQYSGDLTVTGASHCILTGDGAMLKKAIEDEIRSAFVCEGLLCVSPGSQMQEIADYSLQLPLHLLRYYKTSGDKDFLRECLPSVEKMLAWFEKYSRGDGLLENVSDKWNLVDWPENLRDGYMFTPDGKKGNIGCHSVLNAFYVGAVIKTDVIKSILGLQVSDRAEKLTSAFNREFFDETTGLYTDCRGCGHSSLHANALPLFFGLNPEETDASICDFIVSKGLSCGVYMSFFVLKGLCRAGRYKDALALILDEGTWSKMVSQGATTCFEAWGKEDKWNTSLCHPWASAPVSVLAEDILPHIPSAGRIIYG